MLLAVAPDPDMRRDEVGRRRGPWVSCFVDLARLFRLATRQTKPRHQERRVWLSDSFLECETRQEKRDERDRGKANRISYSMGHLEADLVR